MKKLKLLVLMIMVTSCQNVPTTNNVKSGSLLNSHFGTKLYGSDCARFGTGWIPVDACYDSGGIPHYTTIEHPCSDGGTWSDAVFESCEHFNNGDNNGGHGEGGGGGSDIKLVLDKTIVSTKNANNISFTVTADITQSWTITSSTHYSKSGIGKATFTVSSTELGADLADGDYIFTLSSNNVTANTTISVDNTPPRIKKLQALADGKVNVTTEDPIVNGVSAGIEGGDKTVTVTYGKNKQASLNFSIASLSAKQTNDLLNKGNYSVDIKDKVGNTFKLDNQCLDDTEKKQKEIEKQLKKYNTILNQKETKMNLLKTEMNTTLAEYDSAVEEDNILGSSLISYEASLIEYSSQLDSLISSDNPDYVQWESLTTKIGILDSQLVIAEAKSKELDKKINRYESRAKSLKSEIDNLVSEVNIINADISKITSLEGVCLASLIDEAIGIAGGSEVAIANRVIQGCLLLNNIYVQSVIASKEAYSKQQTIKSNELRQRSKLLAKSSKEGERFPERVAKDFNLTQKEKIKFKEEIHKLKKSEGRGGKDNLSLDTLKELAKEIVDARK